jgi:predicted permease
VAEISANFFQMLGGDPEAGRPFAAGEDVAGRDNVAVIGYGLWQQFFGGDPRVLGSTIHLNGWPLTVVGFAPPGFDYPSKAAVWTPTIFDYGRLARARAIMWTAIGRLKPGLTPAGASSLYRASQTRLAGGTLSRGEVGRLKLISMRDLLAGDVRKASMVLLGIVVFVLLTACANIAHLLLSRITERHRELALRAALGASRSRLVQQLITESAVLTLAAAAAGLAVAHWASRLAASAQPALLAAQEYTILDWRVLGFAVGVAALTGLVFGVIPASLIGRMQPGVDTLSSQPGAHDAGVRRMRAVLIAMQAALTLILVAGSLSMGRSFLKILGVDRGFRTEHVVTMSVALSRTPRQGEPGPYYQEALERLRAVPGVESAGAVEFLPLATNSFMGIDFELDGSRQPQMGLIVTATPDYLHTMSTELLRGRDFTPAEAQGFQPVAIVNEAFAHQFGNGIELVGNSMTSLLRKERVTIVGVTRNVRYFGPTDTGTPQVFLPAGAHPPLNMTFVAKVHGKTEAYLPICRAAIQPVDLKVPVFNVRTFDQRLADSLARPRFYTTAVSFFGIFAWLLALLGVYGVASFSIAQRRHEIGVRLAVGASPERLRKMLLRQSLAPVAAGAAIGVAGAIAMGQLVEHLMEGAGPIGIATCVAAAILLTATASAAVWTATRRIARMDPMRVLRSD